jgi:hypothetical protein
MANQGLKNLEKTPASDMDSSLENNVDQEAMLQDILKSTRGAWKGRLLLLQGIVRWAKPRRWHMQAKAQISHLFI